MTYFILSSQINFQWFFFFIKFTHNNLRINHSQINSHWFQFIAIANQNKKLRLFFFLRNSLKFTHSIFHSCTFTITFRFIDREHNSALIEMSFDATWHLLECTLIITFCANCDGVHMSSSSIEIVTRIFPHNFKDQQETSMNQKCPFTLFFWF